MIQFLRSVRLARRTTLQTSDIQSFGGPLMNGDQRGGRDPCHETHGSGLGIAIPVS